MDEQAEAWERAVAQARAELASQPSSRLVRVTVPPAEARQGLLEHEEALRESGAWLPAMDAILALGSKADTGRGPA